MERPRAVPLGGRPAVVRELHALCGDAEAVSNSCVETCVETQRLSQIAVWRHELSIFTVVVPLHPEAVSNSNRDQYFRCCRSQGLVELAVSSSPLIKPIIY